MRNRKPNQRTAEARGAARVLNDSGALRRTVQVYMPAELFDHVHKEAVRDGRTIAGQFRYMAEFYLDAQRATQ